MNTGKIAYSIKYRNLFLKHFEPLPETLRWIAFVPISIILMMLVNGIGTFAYYSVYERTRGLFTAFFVNGVALWVLWFTIWLSAPKHKEIVLKVVTIIVFILGGVNFLFSFSDGGVGILFSLSPLVSAIVANRIVYKDIKTVKESGDTITTFESPIETQKIKKYVRITFFLVASILLLALFAKFLS